MSSKDGWGRAFYSLPINAQRNFGIPCLHLFSGLRIYSDICKHLSSEIQGTHITSQRNSLISALAANTGFYFVRNNERTRHFFNVFVRMGDYVLRENSHQAALTTLINEHMSLHGLRVKVLGPNKFISGYHYHHESKLMKRIKQGKHSAYMFHANWLPGEEKMPVLTEYHNRFLKDECMAKSIDELLDSTGNILGGCCLSHPYKEVISSDEDERDEPFSDGIGLDSK